MPASLHLARVLNLRALLAPPVGAAAAPVPMHMQVAVSARRCAPCVQFGKTLRPALWDGRLLWAGTEVAERWAGYIDGGIRSGEKAATDAAKAVRSA